MSGTFEAGRSLTILLKRRWNMCRVFGATCDGECSVLPFLGDAAVAMDYGYEKRTGAMILSGQSFLCHQSNNPANKAFSEIDSNSFKGTIGVSHNTCRTGMDLITLKAGKSNYALSVDATKEVTQQIIYAIDGDHNFERAIERVMLRIDDPFALALAHKDGLIGARNKGLKPLTFGEIVEKDSETDDISGHIGYYISSQSCVLGGAGRYIHTVNPGEMLIINKGCKPFRKAVIVRPDITRCVMEVIFSQRPDNVCGGQEIGRIRQSIGCALGRKLLKNGKGPKDIINTLAVCIPAGGNYFQYGLAQGTGIESNSAGIIKSIYPKGTIATLPGMRKHSNYMVVPESIDGFTDIVVVNDMMRTGEIAREMAKQIRINPYVQRIHLAVAGVTKSSCPYRAGAYTFEGRPGVRTLKNLGVDSLTYLTPDEIVASIGNPQRIYCTQCLRCTKS